MKRKTKVLLVLILAAVMAVGLLVPTFAASSPAPGSTDQYITWTLSDDGETLTGDKNYYKVNIQPGYYVDIPETYHYHNRVSSSNGRMSLYTNYGDKNIVVAELNSSSAENSYFATKAVRVELNDFFDITKAKEKASKIIATQNDYHFYMFADALSVLDEQTASTDVSVVDLYQYDKIFIRAYDSTGCIYTVVGCLYSLDGYVRYYVDFTKLSNYYFDADGNFSYRSGTVAATVLQGNEVVTAINNAFSSQNRGEFVYSTYFENDEKYAPPEKGETGSSLDALDEIDVQLVGIIAFFIILVSVGLVLPVVPLVLGLMLPRSKKLLKPRGWYAVAGVSAVWMLSAIVLIVLVTVLLLVHLI